MHLLKIGCYIINAEHVTAAHRDARGAVRLTFLDGGLSLAGEDAALAWWHLTNLTAAGEDRPTPATDPHNAARLTDHAAISAEYDRLTAGFGCHQEIPWDESPAMRPHYLRLTGRPDDAR